jgi:hypothetical protein
MTAMERKALWPELTDKRSSRMTACSEHYSGKRHAAARSSNSTWHFVLGTSYIELHEMDDSRTLEDGVQAIRAASRRPVGALFLLQE